MPSPNAVVLGTGMTGFGTADRLHAEANRAGNVGQKLLSWRSHGMLPLRERISL
jgi:hypothetical protein